MEEKGHIIRILALELKKLIRISEVIKIIKEVMIEDNSVIEINIEEEGGGEIKGFKIGNKSNLIIHLIDGMQHLYSLINNRTTLFKKEIKLNNQCFKITIEVESTIHLQEIIKLNSNQKI